jgi:hypothetical protein
MTVRHRRQDVDPSADVAELLEATPLSDMRLDNTKEHHDFRVDIVDKDIFMITRPRGRDPVNR